MVDLPGVMELTAEEQKRLFKEAVREEIRDQYAAFGRFTLRLLVSLLLAALLYFSVRFNNGSGTGVEIAPPHVG